MSATLTAEQEADARQLADRLKEHADESLLAIARLLVGSDERTLFGRTEFAIRDHALRVIQAAYDLHLGQKKTATGGRRSTARGAVGRPATTATGTDTR